MIMMSMDQEYWSKLPYYFHHGALQSMDENTLKGFVWKIANLCKQACNLLLVSEEVNVLSVYSGCWVWVCNCLLYVTQFMKTALVLHNNFKQMLTCTFKQSLLGHFFPVQNDQIVFESKCLFKIIIKCGFPKLGHIKWYYSCSIIERNVKAVVHLPSLLSG